MPDADKVRFDQQIKDTALGLRLRVALVDGGLAVQKVQHLLKGNCRLQDLGSRDYALLQHWRRQYIRASESASETIALLWDAHHWPTDAGRSAGYLYTPKDRA